MVRQVSEGRPALSSTSLLSFSSQLAFCLQPIILIVAVRAATRLEALVRALGNPF
jgi:hypothetical protein